MTTSPISATAAGVPFVVRPPSSGSASAPIVLSWHLMDPPRTETAMAAALPMHGLDAWRVYLGLPMHGSRSLPGGMDEFMRLGFADAVLNLNDPIQSGAAAEAPAALDAVRAQLGIADGPVGVLGGSAGAAVALTVLTDGKIPVSAAALVSPAIRLRTAVAANERAFGITYPWSDASRDVADRFDFLARADEVAAVEAPVMIVIGEVDDPGFRGDAVALSETLGDGAELRTIPGMGHALAEPPGVEPAPQTPHAAEVDAVLTAWFATNLR